MNKEQALQIEKESQEAKNNDLQYIIGQAIKAGDHIVELVVNNRYREGLTSDFAIPKDEIDQYFDDAMLNIMPANNSYWTFYNLAIMRCQNDNYICVKRKELTLGVQYNDIQLNINSEKNNYYPITRKRYYGYRSVVTIKNWYADALEVVAGNYGLLTLNPDGKSTVLNFDEIPETLKPFVICTDIATANIGDVVKDKDDEEIVADEKIVEDENQESVHYEDKSNEEPALAGDCSIVRIICIVAALSLAVCWVFN